MEMSAGARGNLRQVRDAEDLLPLTELLEPRADGIGRFPTDARVYFVEDQRSALARIGGQGVQRKHDTR